jgi:hypothetical protein
VGDNYEVYEVIQRPKNYRLRRFLGLIFGDRAAAIQYAADKAAEDEVYSVMQEGWLGQEYMTEVNGIVGLDLNGSAVRFSQWNAQYTGNPLVTSQDIPDYSEGF